MRGNFMPKTRLGKWSVGLIVLFFLLFASGIFIISRQEPQPNQTFFDNPAASIPMLSAGGAAIAAFFTGVLAIIKNRERSILVFIATTIGLFVTWFMVGEILVPH